MDCAISQLGPRARPVIVALAQIQFPYNNTLTKMSFVGLLALASPVCGSTSGPGLPSDARQGSDRHA
eukprot:scaffold1131_cov161-Amphora_coffeaeformis.AAC.7